jgi:phosphate transport system substrate-binding protein
MSVRNILRSLLGLCTFTFVILATAQTSNAAEELKISGGVSAVTNIFSKIQQPFEAKTGIKLIWTHKDPNGHGGDQTFIDVDKGVAEAGATGSTWPDWLGLMKDKGYNAEHVSDMKYRVIGKDIIQFYTYSGGPRRLTEANIKDLLTGRVKNWKEVGGEDKPVLVVVSGKQPAAEKFLVQHLLEKTPVVATKQVDPQEIAEYVKKLGVTPGAFGFGPVDLKKAGANAPAQPSIGRPITMIWRGTPSKNLSTFMDFIASEGPKLGIAQ